MALSEIQIKKAKAAERPYKLADGEGLFLLVQKNGSKLWRLKYRYHGKEKLLSFGAYPEVGILISSMNFGRSGQHAGLPKPGTSMAAIDDCICRTPFPACASMS